MQTDSCLSNTIFASKLDLDTLRAELLNKLTDIRHEVLKANHTTKSSFVSPQQSQPQQFVPSEPASQQQLNLSANQPETCPEVNLSDETPAQMPTISGLVSPTVITSSETQVIQNTHRVLIAGDSLHMRMSCSDDQTWKSQLLKIQHGVRLS